MLFLSCYHVLGIALSCSPRIIIIVPMNQAVDLVAPAHASTRNSWFGRGVREGPFNEHKAIRTVSSGDMLKFAARVWLINERMSLTVSRSELLFL